LKLQVLSLFHHDLNLDEFPRFRGGWPLQGDLKGPTSAKPGEFVKIQVVVEKGQDLKLQVIPNTDFLSLKELDDTPVVLFPNTKPGTWVVVAAVNDQGKTYLGTYTLTVAGDKPSPDSNTPVGPPDNPKPTPQPQPKDDFVSSLVAEYAKSPDAQGLEQLQKLFKGLHELVGKYQNLGSFQNTLVLNSAKMLKKGQLQSVRDLIAKYLLAELGNDPRTIDQDTLKKVLEKIIEGLQQCSANS